MSVQTLQEFDGSLLLKEIPGEISFIDELTIKGITTTGVAFTAAARLPSLNQRDQVYLQLRPGQEVVVVFDQLPKDFALPLELVSSGYYIPF